GGTPPAGGTAPAGDATPDSTEAGHQRAGRPVDTPALDIPTLDAPAPDIQAAVSAAAAARQPAAPPAGEPATSPTGKTEEPATPPAHTRQQAPPARSGPAKTAAEPTGTATPPAGLQGQLPAARPGPAKTSEPAEPAGTVSSAATPGTAAAAATAGAAQTPGSVRTARTTTAAEPGEPGGPGVAGPTGAVAADRPNRRRLGVIAAVLAAVLAGTVIVLAAALTSDPDRPGAGRLPAAAATGQGASGGTTTGQATPTITGPPTSAQASPGASIKAATVTADPGVAPLDSTPAPPPPGWRTYSGPSGWSIAYPEGWEERPAPGNEGRNFTNPQTGAYLHIDITQQANPSALADWTAHEDGLSAQVPDYRRVKIAPSDGGDGAMQADWEFTYTSGGKTVHVLNRGFVRNGHGYALYWRTADSRWEMDLPLMWQLFSTFRPGP
ncbi:hypothetical protein FrCorBMG51_09290, partial [Protofrankia coriariae]